MALNVLSIGGSRHIGYHSALRFLGEPLPDFVVAFRLIICTTIGGGSTVTFLLRNPAVFNGDEAIQTYVKSGHARLVKGDALVHEDIKRLWAEASSERPVDLLLFTLGYSTPSTSSKFPSLLIMTSSQLENPPSASLKVSKSLPQTS